MHIYMYMYDSHQRVRESCRQCSCIIPSICRGKGTRIAAAYHKDVTVLWQKCAWVDRPVMKSIAQEFCARMCLKWNRLPVLLSMDNLDAHLCDEVRQTFKKGNVVQTFLPPGSTEGAQPIDAGSGRSTRINIGHSIDEWMLSDNNLERWEGGLKAGERRVLMTHWLASGVSKVVKDDTSRVGCFERTGGNLTLNADPIEDAKVRPQGLSLPYNIPPAWNSDWDWRPLPTEANQNQLSETVFEGDDEQADGELNEEDDIVIDDEPVEIIDFLISSIGCWDNFPLMITLEMLTSRLLDGRLFDGRLNTGTNDT